MFLKPSIPSVLPPFAGNSQLRQSLLLAALLHLWLVLMLGNVTGTARPGDGVWGRLNVSLVGVKGESGSGAVPPLATLADGPVGQARPQRAGGAVRPLEAPTRKTVVPTTPGAAKVGAWSEQALDGTPRPTPAEPASPRVAPPSQAAPMLTVPAAMAKLRPAELAGLTLAAPIPLESALLPSATVSVMAPSAAVALSRSKPAALGPALDAARRPNQPALLSSPLPTLPLPAGLTPVVPVAPVDTAPIAAAPAAPVDKQLAAPQELKRQLRDEVSALPAAAPAASLAATPSLPPAPAAAVAAESRPTVQPTNTSAAAAVSAPAAAAPGAVPVLPRPGAPDAGPRLGVDVATPASTPANTPRLNLNLPRPRGAELSSRGSSGVLDLLPAPPDRKSKLSEEMEKAARDDCRKAYGETLGLLAAVPLALDAARSNNKGCRW